MTEIGGDRRLSADEAAVEIARLEREARRIDAAKVALLDRVDTDGAHRADGHFSARVMMRLHANLSGSEAHQRDRVMKCLRDLPVVHEAYGEGLVGTDQVRRIASVWANPRVREHLPVCEAEFLTAAQQLEFVEFDEFCRAWTNRVDQEGAEEKANRRWRRRRIHLTQDFNGFWSLDGRLMSVDGAEVSEILEHLVEAERLADIEKAKAAHGDNWRMHLDRTKAQRRYDAFVALIRRGAGVGVDGSPSGVCVDLVIDDATFEHHAGRLTGAEPPPIDPTDRNRFSRTAGGVFVNPAEVVARSLVDHVRRVVVNGAGVVIDLGRRRRLFTGGARDAVLLSELRCYWRGCWVPTGGCQADHLLPWDGGGRTSPDNGAPACGTHNRIKQQGFHTWRSPDGEWHIARPDGTPVPDHLTHWPGLSDAA